LHERYLKNILKTIADINELLISSISIQSVIENSTKRLVKHEDYRFVWIGLLKNNLLEMSIRTKDVSMPMVKRTYELDSSLDSFALESVKQALDEKKTITKKLPDGHRFSVAEDDYVCNACHITTLVIQASAQDEILGTLSVFTEKEDGFQEPELRILENLATDIGLAISSIYQRSKLEFMELEKISNYEETILAFVNIIEQRDSYTAGHTLRVAEYCRLIAKGFGMEEEEIIKLEKAAILHDIGKVVTPDSILLKPGNLTPLEYELIKEHATAGYKMLSKIKMYEDLAEIIKYHHVHYDGKGYPTIEASEMSKIPFLSFIMGVADAFDAMTTNRIYKPRMSVSEALEEIKQFSGGQFHPDAVRVALETLKDIDVEQTSQLPTNELEQRRFAYFFMDWLTDTYNETYLQTFLNRLGEDYKSMYAVELKSFVTYNKQRGWKEGDLFLKELAQFLKVTYPSAMVFRYHGSNFILLFKEDTIAPTQEEIANFELLKDSNIGTEVNQYDPTKDISDI
jgi:putative nucleotidyltransferase with HDIG domain